MEIIKAKTIAFTGNRILTSRNRLSNSALEVVICDKLYTLLERAHLDHGFTIFLSGMAVGYDTFAATVVLELRRNYPSIRLVAVVPFAEQDAKFTPEQQMKYLNILEQADHSVTICSDGYSTAAFHKRNDFLVANASKFFAYHNNRARTGTGSTIRKAREKGIEVVNLYDLIV